MSKNLNYYMNQVEREWREKEKQIAKKRKQQQLDMKLGREKQIEDLRKAAAIELARDEQEFYQVIYFFQMLSRM